MARQERKKDAVPNALIAYDFETTRIKKGTPRPLYLTAYGENPKFYYDAPIDSMQHLLSILRSSFLLDELKGARFVAWNANNFDAYFIAAALLQTDEFIMRPYLTKGNSLRGLRVIRAEDIDRDHQSQRAWEFLDGMAMLGLAGVSLAKFLATFAPSHGKLTGVINFEAEEFDASNPAHREYAMRDSIGLYHGMKAAQDILIERFNQPLGVTMGNACIKIFKANIPKGVTVRNLSPECLEVVRDYAMRGGYCFCVRRYHGKVWKYDLNQAYAAAMREAALPCGNVFHTSNGIHKFAKIYIARVECSNPNNRIPFYYRTEVGGRLRSMFGLETIDDTWLTSIEINQLKAEGWAIKIKESFCFESSFNMKDYVDGLEYTRMNCEGGASGAIGTMVKAVGNHSYGKTVEQLEPIEYLLSKELPPGYFSYYGDGLDVIDHVFFRFTDPREKDYHQPQIGAFITSHVRMVVRRAALLNPSAWLYADTDCVVFSEDVTHLLDIDPKRYGAWKIEELGTEYRIIAKKVYQNVETGKGNAKGLNVKRLTAEDFEAWYDGKPPVQAQVQRRNFVKVMAGEEMYGEMIRSGTSVEALD